MVLIEEDTISFYCKQLIITINLDTEQEDELLKSRLRQGRKVKYNYDDDSNDSNENYNTDEYNNNSKNHGKFESNSKNNESFVSEYSNYTPVGMLNSKSKSKGSE